MQKREKRKINILPNAIRILEIIVRKDTLNCHRVDYYIYHVFLIWALGYGKRRERERENCV